MNWVWFVVVHEKGFGGIKGVDGDGGAEEGQILRSRKRTHLYGYRVRTVNLVVC